MAETVVRQGNRNGFHCCFCDNMNKIRIVVGGSDHIPKPLSTLGLQICCHHPKTYLIVYNVYRKYIVEQRGKAGRAWVIAVVTVGGFLLSFLARGEGARGRWRVTTGWQGWGWSPPRGTEVEGVLPANIGYGGIRQNLTSTLIRGFVPYSAYEPSLAIQRKLSNLWGGCVTLSLVQQTRLATPDPGSAQRLTPHWSR